MKKLIEFFKGIFTGKISPIKSVLVNAHYCGLKGILKMPIFVGKGTKIISLGNKDSVKIKQFYTGVIKIGVNTMPFGMGISQITVIQIEKSAKLIFEGAANIGKGTKIVVGKDAEMTIGKNFTCNANCILNAAKKIQIGDGCLFAWNVTLIDGDGHKIIENDQVTNYPSAIIVGDKVWITNNVMVLKNAQISNGSVVAARALVTTKFNREKSIVAGVPAKIIKENVEWSYEGFN